MSDEQGAVYNVSCGSYDSDDNDSDNDYAGANE